MSGGLCPRRKAAGTPLLRQNPSPGNYSIQSVHLLAIFGGNVYSLRGVFSILNTKVVSSMAKQMNDATYWREFERNYVTHSMAHYLTAVNALRRKFGYARATDVAEFLNVSRGAASMALAQLKKREWITEDANRFLLLTGAGARIAGQVEQNFLILSNFFEQVLGASASVALSDACKMEHLLSGETGQRLIWLMQHLLKDMKLSREVRTCMEGFSENVSIADLEDAGKTGDESMATALKTRRQMLASVNADD